MNEKNLADEYLDTAHDTLETVPGGNCEIRLERDFTGSCPHDDIMDNYTLTVTYKPGDHGCIELESFNEFLSGLEGVEAGQEAITAFLGNFLFAFFSPEWVEVELDTTHYGIHTTTTKRREE